MECLKWLNQQGSGRNFTTSDGDTADVHAVLARHIVSGASLLELGSGTGHDLPLLADRYHVTASDICEAMVNCLRAAHPAIPALQLDAVSIHALGRFDALFSNKVMQHLDDKEVHESMHRQQQVVRPGGIIAHTFWINRSTRHKPFGSKKTKPKACLIEMVAEHFEIAEVMSYGAFMPNDSLLVIARNRTQESGS